MSVHHEALRDLGVHILLDHAIEDTGLGLGGDLEGDLLGEFNGAFDALSNGIDEVRGEGLFGTEALGLEDAGAVDVGVHLVAEEGRHASGQGGREVNLVLLFYLFGGRLERFE